MHTLALLLALTGCMPKATRDRIEALEAENASLQTRVATLETRVVALEEGPRAPTGPAAPPTPSANDEAEAAALLQRAMEAYAALRMDEARQLLDQLDALGDTRVKARAARLRKEMAVVGQPAGGFDVDRWLQGSAESMDSGVTLLVFFEEWCPHCKRELPELERTQKEWAERGLSTVALTKVTRTSTDERVMAFAKEHGLTFPIGVERDGAVSQRFGVSGIPAAALVEDGTVVWRGHPALITPELLEKVVAD